MSSLSGIVGMQTALYFRLFTRDQLSTKLKVSKSVGFAFTWTTVLLESYPAGRWNFVGDLCFKCCLRPYGVHPLVSWICCILR